MIKKNNFFQSGQTIIEVLIATGVVALVMTALMATMTLSLQNSSQAKYRSLATKLGQEGMESLRQQRDAMGWESFYQVVSGQGNGTYCLNTVPITTEDLGTLSGGACETFPISRTGIAFQREAIITVVSVDEIRFEISVSWQDGADEHNTVVVQEFKNWR